MRMTKLGAVLAIVVLGATGCDRPEPAPSQPAAGEPADAPPAVAAPARPELRSGLWAVTSRADDLATTMRMCVDAEMQRRMSVLGGQAAGGACEPAQVAPRPGGGWTVRSACDMGSGGRTVSEGVLTGDLRTAYRSEMTSTTTGAAVPHMNRTIVQVVQGEHQGPCPAGMAPGDLEGPGGVRLNMLEMAEMAGRGAP